MATGYSLQPDACLVFCLVDLLQIASNFVSVTRVDYYDLCSVACFRILRQLTWQGSVCLPFNGVARVQYKGARVRGAETEMVKELRGWKWGGVSLSQPARGLRELVSSPAGSGAQLR